MDHKDGIAMVFYDRMILIRAEMFSVVYQMMNWLSARSYLCFCKNGGPSHSELCSETFSTAAHKTFHFQDRPFQVSINKQLPSFEAP